MDIAALEDFASDAANAIAKFSVNFTLSTDQFGRTDFIVDPLHWESIGYGDAEIANVPMTAAACMPLLFARQAR